MFFPFVSIDDTEDRNLEIAEDEAIEEQKPPLADSAHGAGDDGRGDEENEVTLDDSASAPMTPRGGVGGGVDGEVRYPEEIEGVSVHPNDKSNPPPPHWHDPDREGIWVHYKVKEEG